MYFKKLLSLAFLLLVSLSGYCQSYSWMRSNFVSSLFTDNAEDYVRRSHSIIGDIEDEQEKRDAESLLKAFEVLSETSNPQPYVCDFEWALREVGLGYRAVRLNDDLQLLKFQAKGHYVVVLKNTLKEHGFMTSFTGRSLDKQSSTRITRGIGPYSCVRMHGSLKPCTHAFTGAQPLGDLPASPRCR